MADRGWKFNTVYTLAWVFPATNTIYVGDTVQAVKLTTGNSVYPSLYTWTIDPSYSGFDSSKPGTTEVRVSVTKGSVSLGRVTIPVTVVPRPILSVEEVVRTAPMGTRFDALGLPTTITVTAMAALATHRQSPASLSPGAAPVMTPTR